MKMEYIAIGISILALVVGFWQGFLSKQQLDLAKQTKSDTEKLLDEIKDRILKIESISDETRKDMKDQVGKLIDQQNEHIKSLLNAPKESSQNQMMMTMISEIMKNPQAFSLIMSQANPKISKES